MSKPKSEYIHLEIKSVEEGGETSHVQAQNRAKARNEQPWKSR